MSGEVTGLRIHGIPWRAYLRHHINLVRWTLDRCADCGHRFAWKGDPRHGMNSETFHGNCLSLRIWRNKADERMDVLRIITDVWEVRSDDVQQLAGNRAPGDGWERSKAADAAWRVFYDMDNARKAGTR